MVTAMSASAGRLGYNFRSLGLYAACALGILFAPGLGQLQGGSFGQVRMGRVQCSLQCSDDKQTCQLIRGNTSSRLLNSCVKSGLI